MYKKKYVLGVVCLIFLFAIMFASAQPPFQAGDFDEGLQIEVVYYEAIPLNQNFTFNAHAYNSTTGDPILNTNLSCYIHIYNYLGTHEKEANMSAIQSNPLDMIYIHSFNTTGQHSFVVSCMAGESADFFKASFEVTESGLEITESRANLTIGLLAILVFLLFISLYALFNVENYIGKFALYWLSHVLMILISFVGWQVGVEGLLGGMALTGIFRIMFWIFTIAVLPMIILSGAWIFYIHAFNEHFEKLIDKGVDTETAFKMANKKSGGWFNGK